MTVRLGDRLIRLRECLMLTRPRICSERARFITESYKACKMYPKIIQRAKALQTILSKMTIFIDEDELIVGNQASTQRAAPVFPEYAINWLVKELDSIAERESDPFEVTENDKSILREIAYFWEGKTLEDRIVHTVPDQVKSGLKAGAIMGTHLLASGDGHLTVDFKKVLSYGFRGLIKEIEDHISRLELSVPGALSKRNFLMAAKIACDSAISFAHRYADKAADLASRENKHSRREELLKIAEVCSHVPENPPRTFWEAVQSVYFIQLILQIESNGHSVSLGRFDQYVYPFFHEDLVEGRITKDDALELISCLFLKMFSILKAKPFAHVQYSAGYTTYQNVTIGGQTLEGGDSTNEITYLCLDSVSSLRLPVPSLSARYHNGSPQPYLTKCAEVIAEGFGMPAMENDEVIIPSLLLRSVTPEDAFDYCMVGCVEVSVPGKWGYRCNGMTFLNMLKVLEITLNNGVDPSTGFKFLAGSGDLTQFQSFDKILVEYKRQLAYFTNQQVVFDQVADLALEELCPDAFCAAVVQDCIARGKSIKEGGAIYDMVSGVQVGLANVANSLSAIKKLIFETGAVKADDVKRALDTNFEDDKGEKIRQMLLNRAPKFGNDDDFVDSLAKEAYGYYVDEISKHHNTRYGRGPIGGTFFGSTSTISSNVPAGKSVGASADGRKAWTPLAEGSSPSPGSDVKGPTAVIKSVSKIPAILITGGQLLNVKFSPAVFQKSSGIGRMVQFLRAFSDLKGWHIQFNVLSAETLKAAQKNPEEYRNLVVRVAGYCAFFTQLKDATQQDIIRRTEHVF